MTHDREWLDDDTFYKLKTIHPGVLVSFLYGNQNNTKTHKTKQMTPQNHTKTNIKPKTVLKHEKVHKNPKQPYKKQNT